MTRETTDRTLGKLLAEAEEGKTQRAALFTEIKRISDSVAKVASCVEKQRNDMKKVLPIVENYVANKNKGIGAIFGLSILGGGGGAGIISWLSGVFK